MVAVPFQYFLYLFFTYISDLFNISKVLELIFGGLRNSDDDIVKNFQNVHFIINYKNNGFALFAWAVFIFVDFATAIVPSLSLNEQFCC